MADKYYGGALYARILIYLRDRSDKSHSVAEITTALFPCQGKPKTVDRKRVARILGNLTDAQMTRRELRPSTKPHIQAAYYQWI